MSQSKIAVAVEFFRKQNHIDSFTLQPTSIFGRILQELNNHKVMMMEYEEFQKLQNAMMRMQEEYEAKLREKNYQLNQEEELRIKCQKKIRYLRAKIRTIDSEKELLTQQLTEKEESDKEEKLRIKCQKKIKYLRAKIRTIDSEKELLTQQLTEKEESDKTNLQKENDSFATIVKDLEQLRNENKIVEEKLQAKDDEVQELKSKVLKLIIENQAYDKDLIVKEEKISCLTKKLADMATNLKNEIEQRKKSFLKKEKEIKSSKMAAANSKGHSLEAKENRRNRRKKTFGDEPQRYEDLIDKKIKLESALKKVTPCFENWKRRSQLEDYLQEVEDELGDLRKVLKQHGF